MQDGTGSNGIDERNKDRDVVQAARKDRQE